MQVSKNLIEEMQTDIAEIKTALLGDLDGRSGLISDVQKLKSAEKIRKSHKKATNGTLIAVILIALERVMTYIF